MFSSVFLQIASPAKRRTGNTILANIPIFRLSPAKSDTKPTKVGPAEHPKSPPNASKANKAVPAFGKAAAALLKVPGHIIPTEKPLTAQANKLKIGLGKREIPK